MARLQPTSDSLLKRYREVANRACGRDAWLFLAALALWCEGMTALGHDPRGLDVRAPV